MASGISVASGEEPMRTNGPVVVRHELLADMGDEHLGHAIYRRSQGGRVSIVAWGDRLVEWPMPKGAMREVVPAVKGTGYSNGGCALDLDGDGTEDIVVARGQGRWCLDPKLYWFHATPSGKWTEHLACDIGKGVDEPHDMLPISFQVGTNRIRGVVAVVDRQQLIWYEIPANPTETWVRHDMAKLPKGSQSGMCVGDVAGHGRPDVVCGTYWVECPADPLAGQWMVHRYSQWENGSWGGMDNVELADLDGDGQPEIVASEAETANARLSVFYRDPKNPKGPWKEQALAKGLYCPHSLVLTDVDGDGRPDVVVGEMTAGGWDFPLNAKPRIIAYFSGRAAVCAARAVGGPRGSRAGRASPPGGWTVGILRRG